MKHDISQPLAGSTARAPTARGLHFSRVAVVCSRLAIADRGRGKGMLLRRIALFCAVALLWSPVAGATGFGFTIQVYDPGNALLGSVESGSLPISAVNDSSAGTTTY